MFMPAAAEEGTLIQSMQEAKANLTGTMKTFENQTCASDIAAALAAHRFLLLFKISQPHSAKHALLIFSTRSTSGSATASVQVTETQPNLSDKHTPEITEPNSSISFLQNTNY